MYNPYSDPANVQKIKRLEFAAETLNEYIASLKGLREDATGIGLWNIFIGQLEYMNGIKIITDSQWDAFCELANKAKGD